MTSKLLAWLSRRSAAPELPPDEAALIAASHAYDGFVRQAAVRRLADFESAAALRAIIARLNDWVPQVRTTARGALQAFMRTERLPALVECLDDILSLERKTRADQRETLAALTAVLATREARPQIEERFATGNRHLARFLFRVLASATTDSDDRFLALAAAHRDVSVRTLAVSALRDFPGEGANRMLARLLRDSHGKVRGEALRELWKRASTPQERDELLRTGLLDTSEGVRALARLLAQREGTDVRALLTAWLREEAWRTANPIGMLGQISWLGHADGMTCVREAIGDARAPVRAAALAAWIRLDRDGADEAVTKALADSSNKVAQYARRCVARGEVALTPAQFAAAIEASLAHGRLRRALATAELLPAWDRLDGLLHCLEHAHDDAEVEKVERALAAWQSKAWSYYTKPDESLAAKIRGRLANLAGRKAKRAIESLISELNTAAPWLLAESSSERQ